MAAEDHLSKKEQHNHKWIYFMICNEVQILPTTLNNQSKPNFPSLKGWRVYKFVTNWKGLSHFWSTRTFPLMSCGLLPAWETKAETSPLCSYIASWRKAKRMLCLKVPKMLRFLPLNLSQTFSPQNADVHCCLEHGRIQKGTGLWQAVPLASPFCTSYIP